MEAHTIVALKKKKRHWDQRFMRAEEGERSRWKHIFLTRFPSVRWFIRDGPGIFCMSLTQLFIWYGCYVGCRYIIQGVLPTIDLALNIILSSLAALSHLSCVFTDPGAVRSSTSIEPPPSCKDIESCKKCTAYKTQRTHHCSVCNRCITRMDHHCPWVNNCVGLYNQKHFLLFLLYVNSLALYNAINLLRRLNTCISLYGTFISAMNHTIIMSYNPSDEDTCYIGLRGFVHSSVIAILSVVFGVFTCLMFFEQCCSISANESFIDTLKKKKKTGKRRVLEGGKGGDKKALDARKDYAVELAKLESNASDSTVIKKYKEELSGIILNFTGKESGGKGKFRGGEGKVMGKPLEAHYTSLVTRMAEGEGASECTADGEDTDYSASFDIELGMGSRGESGEGVERGEVEGWEKEWEEMVVEDVEPSFRMKLRFVFGFDSWYKWLLPVPVKFIRGTGAKGQGGDSGVEEGWRGEKKDEEWTIHYNIFYKSVTWDFLDTPPHYV